MNSLPSSPSSHFWKRSLLSSLLHHFNANLPPRLEKWVSGEKQRMRACVVVHPCVCVHAKERAGEEDTKWKYVSVCNRKEIVRLNSLEREMGKAAGVSAQSKNGRARGRERESLRACVRERESEYYEDTGPKN